MKVCVYCASSSKVNSLYVETARQLGKILAENKHELVYGGGSVGLMGVLADSVLEHGGQVTGVIPRFMVEVEWQHNGLTELVLTETMHGRKEQMLQSSDAIIAMPGGFGTLEELLEAITWKQLGIHTHPIVIVHVGGYYDHLLAQFQQAADELFVRPQHLQMWSVITDVSEILTEIESVKIIHEDMRRFAKI